MQSEEIVDSGEVDCALLQCSNAKYSVVSYIQICNVETVKNHILCSCDYKTNNELQMTSK